MARRERALRKAIAMSSTDKIASSQGRNAIDKSSAGRARLPTNHGVNKFHRDMLRIGGIRTAPESQQPSTA
jgi:hypothetical protein